MTTSQLKEMLKNICCNNGWSYGILWRVNSRNSMLLTPEDFYFDEHFTAVVHQLLQQAQMLGEGAIGQAAFTGKHRWIFSDTYCGEWNPIGTAYNQDVFQEKSQLNVQFASGIKTIAVIPVAQGGVVQFASRHKILERLDFVDHIRSMFRQLESINGNFLGNTSMASNAEAYDNPTRVVASGTSCSNDWYANNIHGNNFKGLMEPSQSAMVLSHSLPFNVGLQTESMNSIASSSSFQTGNAETGVLSSLPNMQSQQVFAQMTTSPANSSSARYPSMNTWNNEYPTLTPYEQQLLSVNNEQQHPSTFSSSRRDLSFSSTAQNLQGESPNGLYNSNGILNTNGFSSVNPVGYQQSIPLVNGSSSFQTFSGENPTDNNPQWLSQQPQPLDTCNGLAFPMNDHRQQALSVASSSSGLPGNDVFDGVPVNNITGHAHNFVTAQPLDTCNRLDFPLNDNQQQALGVASSPSGFAGVDVFNEVPVNNVVGSAHNSVNDTINMVSDMVCDGNVNSSTPMLLPSDNDLFGDLDFALNQNHGTESWDDILLPVGSGSQSNLSNGTSECVSELDVGSMPRPQKDLFAEFGLEEILEGLDCNVNRGNIPSSEQLSAPISRTGASSADGSQVQFLDLSFLCGSINGLVPESDQNSMHSNPKESTPKSQVGSWIDDSYSINAESAVTTQPMRSNEQAKGTKKRARPGESSRPRPKDRQLIQERVKELREIVPNTGKCSIDVLLDRAVKHMLFLQSVTKYADKLKEADGPKMLATGNGVVLKDTNATGSGSTWAFEIGGQTLVCPIVVEDINPPGQMLVEMLCEDRGFFLEIADTIRGFGLTILKGVMEARANKIWARFIVEANGRVTRLEIFISLVHLLQQTVSGVMSFNNQSTKAAESGAPSSSNS